MRIAVVGAGAVGGYFGGRLVAAGHEVAFLVRGETLTALRERGLKIDSPLGDLNLPSVEASDDAAELSASLGSVETVIVAVKAWQVPKVAESIRPLVGPETQILPLQNGVEAPRQLAALHGSEAVLGGLCKIISKLETRGHVKHLGAEPTVIFGKLSGSGDSSSKRTERLRRALEEAGVRAEITPDIEAAMWEKFLFISSISGLGAVSRVPLGELRQVPETRALLEQLMREVTRVAGAHTVRLPADVVERTMAFVDSLPAEGTASMQRDLVAGRPSELDSQNGAVVRLAAEAGVAVPAHRVIYHALLPLEQLARAT